MTTDRVMTTKRVMTTNRDSILYVADSSPLVPFSGAQLRNHHVLRWLMARYTVDVAFEGKTGEIEESTLPLEALRDVHVVPHRSRCGRIAALCAPLPYHHARANQEGMRRVLREHIPATPYRFAWLGKTIFYPAVRAVYPTLPIFVDQDAVPRESWSNLRFYDARLPVRIAAHLNWPKVKRFEATIRPDIACTVCISEHDRLTTEQDYPGTYVRAVRAGVDTKHLSDATGAEIGDGKTLLFCGSGAGRNVAAARWFIDEVLTALREHDDCYRFLWIGNVPAAVQRELAAEGVAFTGKVAELGPSYARGAVVVAPFFVSEGIKLKLLEALAFGKVLVATPAALAGLSLPELPFVREAATAQQFVEQIRLLCGQTDSAIDGTSTILSGLSVQARSYVKAEWTWERTLSPLEEIIETTLRRWSLQPQL